MTKDAYYFSHDANARNDEKILMLRADFGWEGYGLYWALIEMMFESSDSCLSLDKVKGIAISNNVDITLLQDVINTCITQELFVSDDRKFWSESLVRRKEKYLDIKRKRSEAGKKGMAKRWANQQSDNDVITNDNNDITKNNKGKERKGKESKDIIPFSEIVSFLNQKTGKKFKHTTNKTQTSIEARWNEGFVVDDFKKVINAKVNDWKHDEKMNKYLRPETLFGTKFEGYLNESVSSEDVKESDPDIALLEKKRELEMSIELGEEYWRKFESIEEYENMKRELRELEQQL